MEFDGEPGVITGSLHVSNRKSKYRVVESFIFCLSNKEEHQLYRDLLNKHALGEVDILHKKDYSYQKSEMLYMHVEWGVK